MKFQTCSKATLSTANSVRGETTTQVVAGKSYIMKERNPDDRKKKDTWHEKKESTGSSRGYRRYGHGGYGGY